jgi:hypothetical protein
VPDFLQDFDFTSDPFNVLLIVNFVFFQNLDRNFLASESVLAKFDLSKGAFTEMLAYIWFES